MARSTRGLAAAAILIAGLAPVGAATAQVDTARATLVAAARVPGIVLGVAPARDRGRPVYSIVIRTAANQIARVEVDARDATVLRVSGLPDRAEPESP
jgi:hypothetical protein